MLIQDYFYYFNQIASIALQSLAGVAAILLALAALFLVFFYRRGLGPKRYIPAAITGLFALVIFTVTFYGVVYEYELPTERRLQMRENANDEECGTAWTIWITSGIGLSNPCEKGCYRGITLQQQARMTGFPPWPENRREFQCWVRKGPAPIPNRGQDPVY
jgi:hypothetical protein